MARNGLKWTLHDDDVLGVWVAEMDFGLAPAVSAALHQAVDEGLTGYPYPEAEAATAMAATAFWKERFGWDVPADFVFPAPDAIEAARRVISHLTREGAPVVLHSPVYFPFYSMVERAGRDVVEVRSERDPDGVYRLDVDGIDRALDEGAGSIVLCDPWNPTGRVLSVHELGEVVELARKYDARIIADSVHQALTYSPHHHIPVAALDPDRVITVTSASKAWNLPGLKCAQVVLTNESDRSAWADYFTAEKVGVSTFGLIGSEAAYRDGVAWLDDILERLAFNRRLFSTLVEELLPRAGYREPEGTYLAWLDLSAYGVDEPAEHLLEEARVAVTAGGPFGAGGDGHIRFNFATEADVIVESIERIAASLTRP